MLHVGTGALATPLSFEDVLKIKRVFYSPEIFIYLFALVFHVSFSHEFTAEFSGDSATCDVKHPESRGDASSSPQPDANEGGTNASRGRCPLRGPFCLGSCDGFSLLSVMYVGTSQA